MLTALTFAGTGRDEARAQLRLADAMIHGLLDRLGECFDCPHELQDRIGDLSEVLRAFLEAAVPGVNVPGRLHGGVGVEEGVVSVAHATETGPNRRP